jgi:hypothetical protein
LIYSEEKSKEISPSKAEPFAIFALVLQVAFIVLFWVLTDYDNPLAGSGNTQNDVGRYYSFFTDVAVMMFIGIFLVQEELINCGEKEKKERKFD